MAQSPLLSKLYATPGNPGIAEYAELVDLDLDNHADVIRFCQGHDIDLVVIGPEAPLVNGLGNSLRAEGIKVFGPDAAPAQLEGSKGFTKDLCTHAGIPTARYVRVSAAGNAIAALGDFGYPVVIKADGLAAGKGVVIAGSRREAEAAIADMFGGEFGDAGASVVIEEFLTGEEASLFALTDGETVRVLGSAQDHKRVGDGDIGPNTGGMGAYSPARVLTPELEEQAMREIVEPTVAALKKAGIPYSGVLYAGLMLTSDGPKLIEYNARFGDPECQVLMTRLDVDIVALLDAVASGTLATFGDIAMVPDMALTIVMAANGYPGTPEKGGHIAGIAEAERAGASDRAKVFHAGTALDQNGGLIANGGRVLNVTATGTSVREAREAAYAAVDAIEFPTGFCRRDIGWREVERETQSA